MIYSVIEMRTWIFYEPRQLNFIDLSSSFFRFFHMLFSLWEKFTFIPGRKHFIKNKDVQVWVISEKEGRKKTQFQFHSKSSVVTPFFASAVFFLFTKFLFLKSWTILMGDKSFFLALKSSEKIYRICHLVGKKSS